MGSPSTRDHTDSAETRLVPAFALRQSLGELIEEIRQTGLQVIITKRGVPVAKLVAYTEEEPPGEGSS